MTFIFPTDRRRLPPLPIKSKAEVSYIIATNFNTFLYTLDWDSKLELARAAGVHRDHLYDLHYAKKTPRVDTLHRIAASMGVHVRDFLGDL